MADDGDRAQGRPAARAAAPWLKLLEALAIAAISEESLLGLLRAGDVKSRFCLPNGLRPPVPPEYWTRASVDWTNSRIKATLPPGFSGPVEVSRKKLIANTGGGAVGKQVGRRPRWDWEQAAIDVIGVVYGGKKGPPPKRQADVERLLADWFLERPDETGETPSESGSERMPPRFSRCCRRPETISGLLGRGPR